ncbi:sensor histidine kinase [Roseibium limicola]|nr:ATP-binding protein [Roseibium limicola]
MRRRSVRNTRIVVIVLFLLISAGGVWLTALTSYRVFESDLETRVNAALQVQSGVLESHLEKFRVLAPIVARSPNAEAAAIFNDEMVGRRVSAIAAGMAGAEEVWFLTAAGRPVASSLSGRQAVGPLGWQAIAKAYGEAAQGQLGRQLLAGTADRPSSYVFASPIRVQNRLAGILAVRVPLAPVEQVWALTKYPIFANDETGRVVVTNQAAQRGSRMMTVNRDNLLKVSKELPVLGWRVHAFADPFEARRQAWRAVVIAVLVCVIFGSVLWNLVYRWEDQLRRRRRQKAEALRLERKVQHRTAELRQANAQLKQEVQDRQRAEEELHHAQAELVQAAKLATLGEMSASLSHEYNQPLAAIRSDADVAEMLITRGRAEEARGNLQRIGAMVDRMAEIARTLKGFTRKAGTDVRRVNLHQVVEEAALLLRPQVKRTGTRVSLHLPDAPVHVAGGKIRLEQVVVNLLSNAVDAVSHRQDPEVSLKVEVTSRDAFLSVEDNGDGVSRDIRAQVFEPFFTTKQSGSGLGLGLSIAYKIVHDFNGSLSVEDSAAGGARFVMRLPLAGHETRAAD